MSEQKEFPQGIIFKLPNDKAPDFVKGKLSIKRLELIQYLQSKNDEWINYDLKVSKGGKAYIDIDEWKPTQQEQPQTAQPQASKAPTDSLPW